MKIFLVKNLKKKLLSVCFVLALLICIFDVQGFAGQKSKSKSHTVVTKNIESGDVQSDNYNDSSKDKASKKQVISNQVSAPNNVIPSLTEDTADTADTSGSISLKSVITGRWYRVLNTLQDPYTKVCYLKAYYSNGTNFGTGFVIGPNVVVTAGHIIYDQDMGWCNSVEIIPAQNGSGSQPYGVFNATLMHTNWEWINDANHDYDWAYLDTDRPIGNTVGWFGLSTGANVNDAVNVTGYPYNKNGEMWNGPGNITSVTSTRISYNCDMLSGCSGSPVYDSSGMVRGINAYEYSNTTIPNYGPRITDSLFRDLVSAKVQYNLPGPGYLDVATASNISGWAINPNDRYARVEVHIYIYNADTGQYVVGIPGIYAQNFRSDVGYHSYSYTPNLPSGRYQVNVYAIYDNNPLLINSGKIFTK